MAANMNLTDRQAVAPTPAVEEKEEDADWPSTLAYLKKVAAGNRSTMPLFPGEAREIMRHLAHTTFWIINMSEPCIDIDQWYPIELAPKDGTAFLAYWLRRRSDGRRYEAAQAYVVAHFQGARLFPSWIAVDDPPTHWRPLPAPPSDG